MIQILINNRCHQKYFSQILRVLYNNRSNNNNINNNLKNNYHQLNQDINYLSWYNAYFVNKWEKHRQNMYQIQKLTFTVSFCA